MTKFEELYLKLLSDPAFRQELHHNPSAALTSIGIEPTAELLAAIREIIHGVTDAERHLGRGHTHGMIECVT